MQQISFFDKDYFQIIKKVKQKIKETFINVVAKVQDAVQVARGWRFQEIKMEVIGCIN